MPSATDTFDGLRAKSARLNALGVDVYIISTDAIVGGTMRVAPGSTALVNWTGKPIAALGGLSIEMAEGRVAVRTPEGLLISTDAELLDMLAAGREAAEAQAEVERARAIQLEARLRALGAEP